MCVVAYVISTINNYYVSLDIYIAPLTGFVNNCYKAT